MNFNEVFSKYINDESFKNEVNEISEKEGLSALIKKYDMPYSEDELAGLINDKIESANCNEGGEHERNIGGYHFSGHVGMYDLTEHNNYYFTEDGKDHWIYGELFTTYEKKVWKVVAYGTERVHNVYRTIENGNELSPDVVEILGKDWTAYTTMTR